MNGLHPGHENGVTTAALPYVNCAGGDAGDRPMRIGVWRSDGPRGADARDRAWAALAGYGQAHGLQFDFHPETLSPDALDAIVFLDRPDDADPRVARWLAAATVKYLCLTEAAAAVPHCWESVFLQRFDRVFSWRDDYIDHRRGIRLNTAIEPDSPFDFDVLAAAFEERRLCTCIADAETINQADPARGRRHDDIAWLCRHAGEEFDLYGLGWDAVGNHGGYARPAQPLETLAGYRFALCYEDFSDHPGYVGSTLFDCLRAGTVPVYLGAEDIGRHLPMDCIIDRNAFTGTQDILDHLRGMDAATHAGYLDRIRDYLGSARVYPYTIECFIAILSGFLVRDVRQRRGDAPDVTVAIPTYNYGRFLGTAIDSALGQDVRSIEVLVLDNASSDATREVMARYAGDPRVRYMRNSRNLGGQHNWNNAFRIPTGRYLAILSADDFYRPGHLGRMVRIMDDHPAVALAYCPCHYVNDAGNVTGVLEHPGHASHDYVGGRNEVADMLAFDNYIAPSAALFRRTAFDLVGKVDFALSGSFDWDLWIRIAELAPDFAFFKEPRVCYRIHAAQSTVVEVRNANTLYDHVDILWNCLARVGLAPLRHKAMAILALLNHRYLSYPEELVAQVKPHVDALTRLLINGDAEVSVAAAWEQATRRSALVLALGRSHYMAAREGSLDVVTLVDHATRLAQAARADLAAELYRLWLEQSTSPLLYTAAYNLGCLYELAGAVDAAESAYRRALAANDDFVQARQGLVRVQGRTGRTEPAPA